MAKENGTRSGNTGDAGKSKRPPRSAAPRKYNKFQRPRGGEARSISDLMPEIGRAAFRRFGFIQSSVVSRWPEIVGERYADVSLPESIRFPRGEKEGGTLHLLVSGAHATLMQHITPEIIERVNRFFGYGAISQVRFRQGVVTPPKQREKRVAPPPSLKPAPIELGESLRDIGDPELNRVLESLATGIAKSEEAPQIGIKIAGKVGGSDKPARSKTGPNGKEDME
ncbi:hypothetical protein SAMN02745824_3239 [Parasphingorhabdus marina DSM 22363]|uniref:DUF721 domain-containing protein n=1 Tax=Parasphingorhabdus marina DSM 22363 TaxID=1123272 RepID=A0A1N6HDK1_9SPHN|nr:DciA family protein [Parasphingorhabdus marina]SIO17777.1 hypothetical protein SAMN02745824_3239 [Parasphingorhabdus marina DSM 22363]